MQIENGIEIDIGMQQLRLFRETAVVFQCPVSTALNGSGERMGSECTPRGEHRIRLKIGNGCPRNAVFVGRRFTGEIYTPAMTESDPGRDWILTRIIWLSGLQTGFNRGGECDSLRRFIYIHGTPKSEPMGEPRSHGCIRLYNDDLIHLFDNVENGMRVVIRD